MNKFWFYRNLILARFRDWTTRHQFQLATFNIILVILLLLRSAGYFDPFFTLTINSIFFTALVLSIFILGTRSTAAFVIALLFWVWTALLRIFKIEVWADRTALYTYESLLVGLILLLFERLFTKKT